MIAIGKALRQRGVDVLISLAEPYASIAEAADLQVEAVFSQKNFDDLLGDPVVWKPIRGVRRILSRVAAEFLPLHDAVIRKHHRPGKTILISHPLDFASSVYREVDVSTPLVDIHLAPATLRVPSSPARLSPWWFEISRPPWAVKTSYWIADRLILDPALQPSLGKLRKNYGLPNVNRYLDQWWLSPDRILAMFPAWFAPETASVSERMMHVGFPLDDVDQASHDETERVLDTVRGKPIIFTAGTAHRHCRRFFEFAVDACRRLDQPGLLLSTHPENIPRSLPPNLSHVTYVSLGRLLRRASGIVHHGGIGTTSQALAAGVPQVVRPNAFDQFDNATRVQRLRCGHWLKDDRQLWKVLREVLGDRQMAQQCRDVADRFSNDRETGAAAAANEIERILQPSN